MTLGAEDSPCFESLVPNQIIDSGPYGCVRPPIYTANLALLVGLFVATGSVWLLMNCVIIAVYYVNAAVSEERALCESLPSYRAYLTRTGRFLPRLLK